MINILHISDLHFGETLQEPNPPLVGEEQARKFANSANQLLSSEYNGELDLQPHCIVITGDLTNEAKDEEFKYAGDFIERLSNLAEIPYNKIIIVPGNHDVDWSVAGAENNAKKFEGIANLINRFDVAGNWQFDKPTISPIYNEHEVPVAVIFGVNSCMVERKAWSGIGYIDDDQFLAIEEWLRENDQPGLIKIVALHHHVVSAANYWPSYKNFMAEFTPDELDERPPMSQIMNAKQFNLKCRDYGISAVLHGHAHTPLMVNYTDHLDTSRKNKRISRSLAILGAGSLTSDRLEKGVTNHCQVVIIDNERQSSFINVHQFKSKKNNNKKIAGMELEAPVMMAGGQHVVEIPGEALASLRNRLNQSLIEISLEAQSRGEEYLVTDAYSIYDQILKNVVDWLQSTMSIGPMGSAAIARYIKDLGVYKHVAIYDYPDSHRFIAYSLTESKGITIRAAKKCKTDLIRERKKCIYANTDRNKYYTDKPGGRDQTCLAVPLNSTNKEYAYAVLNFARPRNSKSDEYSQHEKAVVDSIRDIVEMALRQAELMIVANQRRRLLYTFNDLSNYSLKDKDVKVSQELDSIAEKIFDGLCLNLDHGDKLAIFLPEPPSFKTATCIASKGFTTDQEDNMRYELGKKVGLTGGVIDSRKPDYCVNHLAESQRSKNGTVTSRACMVDETEREDLYLSFAGVPLGGKGALDKYNKGALVVNLALPLGHGSTRPKGLATGKEEFLERYYGEPMQIIASLLEGYIADRWKSYCEEEVERAQL